MRKNIIGVFVLLSFLMVGLSKADAMSIAPMPYYRPAPVISGVSGPQSLEVGKTGTWRISAYDQGQSNLSYSVDWGDAPIYVRALNSASVMASPEQTSTFSHSYVGIGNYTVTFNVTNDYGQSATTSLSVNVNGNEAQPSVKVTSPDGGEKIKIGQKYLITWDSRGLDNADVSIYLEDDSYKCSVYAVGCWNSFGINGGFNSNTGSYLWDTNEKMFGDGGPNSQPVSPGIKYKIKVCVENVCDESNDYFKITSPDVTSLVISGVSGPQSLRVDKTGTWRISAYDQGQSNLSYSVDWGDKIIYANTLSSTSSMLIPKQTATFSHSYQRAGNYTVKFTVTNSNGQSVTKSLKIKVKGMSMYDYLTNWNTKNNERLIK